MEMAVSLMCQFTAEPESFRSLILEAKAGDLAAFEQIVTRYERIVLRVARRLLGIPSWLAMRRRKFFYGCRASWANFKKKRIWLHGCIG